MTSLIAYCALILALSAGMILMGAAITRMENLEEEENDEEDETV